MTTQLLTTAEDQVAAYAAKLKALPSYDIKAEYIVRIGKGWDALPRPKQEAAIAALVEHLRAELVRSS